MLRYISLHFSTQTSFTLDWALDLEYQPLKFKTNKIGSGHSKTGTRRRWKKSDYFEQDLLQLFADKFTTKRFKTRFIYSPKELNWFFNTIKKHLMRPQKTEQHACNKLLLFMDKLRNCLSGEAMSDKYLLGVKTCYDYVSDVVRAILESYNGRDPIAFPNISDRVQMVEILQRQGRPMPTALFSVDASDTRCTGRHISERCAYKYRVCHCFFHSFVYHCIVIVAACFQNDIRY